MSAITYKEKRSTSPELFFGVSYTKGFTLIELLVSVALFSIVMMISVGTLLSMVDANRQAQSMRTVTDNLSFALDSMTRTIRTGTNYYCNNVGDSGGTSLNAVQNCNGLSQLYVTDDAGRRVRYYLSGQKLMRQINTDPAQEVTATEAKISTLKFYVEGALIGIGDNRQPTVTMILQGNAGEDIATNSEFNIQTTATQRLLDI